jgi:biopolymer transport protein ExbB/TolQ
MSTPVEILIIVAALAVIVMLGSYAMRGRTEQRRSRRHLAAESETRLGRANDGRRRASQLAAMASAQHAEAERLDQEAAQELEAARGEEELSAAAKRKARRQGILPINLSRNRD